MRTLMDAYEQFTDDHGDGGPTVWGSDQLARWLDEFRADWRAVDDAEWRVILDQACQDEQEEQDSSCS